MTRDNNKMIKIVQLVIFVAAVIAVETAEIRHLDLNGAHLIETSQSNYAITSPSLTAYNWKTLSVNGDNVLILSRTCESLVKSLKSLTEAERALINTAKAQISQVSFYGQQTNGALRYSSSSYSLDGSQSRFNTGYNMKFTSFQSNGYSVDKSDENNFSVTRADLPNNVARVFVAGDIFKGVMAYVYKDGQVQMKPSACLQANEQQFIQQVRQEVQHSEQLFKQNMDRFQQNMQNMQQNMQNNMNNMFGNGFPFNNNRFPLNMNQGMQQFMPAMPGLNQFQQAAFPASQANAHSGSYAFAGNPYNTQQQQQGNIRQGSQFYPVPTNNFFNQRIPYSS